MDKRDLIRRPEDRPEGRPLPGLKKSDLIRRPEDRPMGRALPSLPMSALLHSQQFGHTQPAKPTVRENPAHENVFHRPN